MTSRPRKPDWKEPDLTEIWEMTVYDRTRSPLYPDRTPRLRTKFVKALRVRKKEWVPPKAPRISVLKQERYLPLMDVLNFLAFNASSPRKGMSPLMRKARWDRAFEALCVAARDGKVKLFETPRDGPLRRVIEPTEFESLSLVDEHGTIGVDLTELSTEQLMRAQREDWRLRDVHVDRESLMGWFAEKLAAAKAVPKVVGPKGGRPSYIPKVEAELTQWIKGKRVAEEVIRLTPDEKGNDIGLGRLDRALGKRCNVNPDTIGRARLKPKNKSLSDWYAVALKQKK
jgi:hypothetical protein